MHSPTLQCADRETEAQVRGGTGRWGQREVEERSESKMVSGPSENPGRKGAVLPGLSYLYVFEMWSLSLPESPQLLPEVSPHQMQPSLGTLSNPHGKSLKVHPPH